MQFIGKDSYFSLDRRICIVTATMADIELTVDYKPVHVNSNIPPSSPDTIDCLESVC